MKLADDEVALVKAMLEEGPVLMYADRLAVAPAPPRFLVTPNVQRLVGCRPADVGELYDRLDDLVQPAHRDRLASARLRSVERRAVLVEVQLRDPDGRVRWWRVTTQRPDDTLVLGFLWDITESVEAAAAAQVARSEAEQSRDRALAANQAKTEFLSRMSHELRTPLNSIVGFGQLLELQELSPTEQEWVANLVVAGRHLRTLVDEVLDVVGIESGRLAVSVEAVDVVEVVDEAIGLLHAAADQRSVSLHRRAPAAHPWATGDHHRLLQILLNLLDNAIRYNRELTSVSVTCELVDDRCVVVVQDDGVGLTDAQVARAFQPFDRLGVERTGITGTGMGLTLSRSLAELMDGSLDMSSVVGSGTALRLELPAGVPAELRPAVEQPREVAHDPLEDQLSILYIEDNVANLRLMESVMDLRPAVTLMTAMRGSLGFEIARDQRPDLVLVDLHLPDIDGREVLRLLRTEAATAELPVAVVSADATPGRVDEVRALGADYYLTKPIDIHELISIVDHHLDLRRPGHGDPS